MFNKGSESSSDMGGRMICLVIWSGSGVNRVRCRYGGVNLLGRSWGSGRWVK